MIPERLWRGRRARQIIVAVDIILTIVALGLIITRQLPGAPTAALPQPTHSSKVALPTREDCPVDYSQAPDLATVAKQAQQVCEIYLPKVEAFLGPTPQPAPHKIIFDYNKYAAYVQNNEVHVSIDYARERPDDIPDTMGHEITHLVQNYNGQPSWTTEGIADFMRHRLGFVWSYFNCKPTERWTSGYGCTASFLTYVSRKYDDGIVPAIHHAAMNGTYSDQIFVQRTGKTAETLYAECRQAECRGGHV